MTMFRLSCVAAAAALLVACGGSDDSVRGELIDPPAVVTTLTAAQIDATTAASGLQALSGKAKCDVKVVALNYRTPGAKDGEMSNASGVMLVPGGMCSSAAPLVANARAPRCSNPHPGQSARRRNLPAGCHVRRPGLCRGRHRLPGLCQVHLRIPPYLHADSQATTIIDSVRAARNAADAVGAKLSGKVMFTGYSQGSHASMAAHRAAERDHAGEFNVVAGAHLWAIQPVGLFAGPRRSPAYQFFVPMIVTSWQRSAATSTAARPKPSRRPTPATSKTCCPTPR